MSLRQIVHNSYFQAGLLLLLLHVLLAISWWKYGMALSVDSANYASVARSIAAGTGFLQFDGFAFTNAAPLYPLLLSLGVFMGMPVLQAGMLLQLLAINTLFIVLFKMAQKADLGNESIWFVCLSGLAYFSFLHAYLFLLSETVFMACLAVWLYLQSFHIEDRKTKGVSAILLACLFSLRYAGFLLIPGILLFWIWRKKKPLYIFLQLLPSLFAVSFWFFRNQIVGGSYLGAHALDSKLSISGFIGNIQAVFSFVSGKPLESLYMILFVFLWLVAGLLLWVKKEMQKEILLPVFLLIGSYLLMLFMQSNLNFLQMPRYLSPFWPFVLMVIPLAIKGTGMNTRLASMILIALVFVQLLVLGRKATQYSEDGAGGFHTRKWQNPQLHETLLKIPEGELISNFPDMVWWISQRNCMYTPFGNEKKPDFQKRAQGKKILIWFKNNQRDHVMANNLIEQITTVDRLMENEVLVIERIEIPCPVQ